MARPLAPGSGVSAITPRKPAAVPQSRPERQSSNLTCARAPGVGHRQPDRRRGDAGHDRCPDDPFLAHTEPAPPERAVERPVIEPGDDGPGLAAREAGVRRQDERDRETRAHAEHGWQDDRAAAVDAEQDVGGDAQPAAIEAGPEHELAVPVLRSVPGLGGGSSVRHGRHLPRPFRRLPEDLPAQPQHRARPRRARALAERVDVRQAGPAPGREHTLERCVGLGVRVGVVFGRVIARLFARFWHGGAGGGSRRPAGHRPVRRQQDDQRDGQVDDSQVDVKRVSNHVAVG